MAVEIQPLDILFPRVLLHSRAHEPQLNDKMGPFLENNNKNSSLYADNTGISP